MLEKIFPSPSVSASVMLVILSKKGKLHASWAQENELAKLGFLHIKQVRTLFIFNMDSVLINPLIFKH